MSQTHDLAEWASFVSLGVSVHAAFSVPYFLFVDAELADFDPRPALSRAVESGRFDALLIAVTNTRHTTRETAARVRRAPLHAAISAAALLALLIPASPEATR